MENKTEPKDGWDVSTNVPSGLSMGQFDIFRISHDCFYAIPMNEPRESSFFLYPSWAITNVTNLWRSMYKKIKSANVELMDKVNNLEARLRTEKILSDRHYETLQERDEIIRRKNELIELLKQDLALLTGARNKMAEKINDLNNKLHRHKRANLKRGSSNRKARRNS